MAEERTTAVIFAEMNVLWADFAVNHEKGAAGNRAATSRARKAINSLKKLVTEYRKLSVAESKAK